MKKNYSTNHQKKSGSVLSRTALRKKNRLEQKAKVRLRNSMLSLLNPEEQAANQS